MSDKKEIMDTLDEYASAYCTKDLDRLMQVFVDDGPISLIGTGADELCSGRDAVAAVFERNFKDATATRFMWNWMDIIVRQDAAVVACTLDIHLTVEGEQHVVPIRWTVSLIRQDGAWKWLHRHASAAAAAQDEGKAYPIPSGASE